MIHFLKRQSTIFVAFFAILIVCTSVGCKAIYSDDADIENAFRKDATFDWVGTARPKDKDIGSFGVSNKAKAIEKDLGGK